MCGSVGGAGGAFCHLNRQGQLFGNERQSGRGPELEQGDCELVYEASSFEEARMQ